MNIFSLHSNKYVSFIDIAVIPLEKLAFTQTAFVTRESNEEKQLQTITEL